MIVSPIATAATDPDRGEQPMDALLVLTSIVVLLVVLAALSTALGVDSRDGFTNERLRSGLS
jgi:hypothetical protein